MRIEYLNETIAVFTSPHHRMTIDDITGEQIFLFLFKSMH